MSWWEVRHTERGQIEATPVVGPYSDCSRWRWVQFDWNDGTRSCFCNVAAPWQWLALILAAYVIRRGGRSGERWK